MIRNNISVSEARALDALFIEKIGVPGIVLLENAGRDVARETLRLLKRINAKKAYILCGGGNNGGDGFVAGRHLMAEGIDCRFFVFKKPRRIRGDARVNLRVLERLGADIRSYGGFRVPDRKLFGARGILIDALAGIGFSGAPRKGLSALVTFLNNLGMPIVAVDVPTGFDADTGIPQGECVRARVTVTMFAPKRGMLARGAGRFVGKMVVSNLGFSLLQRRHL